jgi:hypothetical protein
MSGLRTPNLDALRDEAGEEEDEEEWNSNNAATARDAAAAATRAPTQPAPGDSAAFADDDDDAAHVIEIDEEDNKEDGSESAVLVSSASGTSSSCSSSSSGSSTSSDSSLVLVSNNVSEEPLSLPPPPPPSTSLPSRADDEEDLTSAPAPTLGELDDDEIDEDALLVQLTDYTATEGGGNDSSSDEGGCHSGDRIAPSTPVASRRAEMMEVRAALMAGAADRASSSSSPSSSMLALEIADASLTRSAQALEATQGFGAVTAAQLAVQRESFQRQRAQLSAQDVHATQTHTVLQRIQHRLACDGILQAVIILCECIMIVAIIYKKYYR